MPACHACLRVLMLVTSTCADSGGLVRTISFILGELSTAGMVYILSVEIAIQCKISPDILDSRLVIWDIQMMPAETRCRTTA